MKRFSVLIKKVPLCLQKKKKSLHKKYKDFQLFMIKEWKSSKCEIWYKMYGRKIAVLKIISIYFTNKMTTLFCMLLVESHVLEMNKTCS